MMPLLVGGTLLVLLGTLMLLAAAFLVSQVWGVLCLLVFPLQWAFALLHWQKAWDALLLQFIGLVFLASFFMQSDAGFSLASVEQAWTTFQREQGMLPAASPGGTAVIQGEVVQTADPDAPVIDHSMRTVDGNAELTTVTVKGEESKPVDDKPIYKCTDGQGKETFSTKPCEKFYVPPKP